MGFLDDLLTGSKPKLETASLSTISPEQRTALNALLESLGRPATAYTGQQSAPLSGLEDMSLTALEQRSQQLAAPDPTLDAAGSTLRGQMDVGANTASSDDYFTQNVQNPMLRDFEKTILPT